MRKPVYWAVSLCLLLAGCDFSPEMNAFRAAQVAQNQAISQEPPGDYFIGRRYYNRTYKFWGYVRKPGQPWKEAQLVMFNEKQKLAPDRADNHFGEDNGFEYRLYGRFTGDTVYEPPSNSLYPEFELKGYELINRNPAPIFAPNSDPSPLAIHKPAQSVSR